MLKKIFTFFDKYSIIMDKRCKFEGKLSENAIFWQYGNANLQNFRISKLAI